MLLSVVNVIFGRSRQFIFFGLLSVLLAACGGGGGGGTTTAAAGGAAATWGTYHASDISAFFTGSRGGGNAGAGGAGANGGAGDGAPIRNATVTITDSTSPVAQSTTATTGTDGYYQADITGFKPPLIASVTYKDAAGATVTRYSPSVSAIQTNGFITINITGLTTYLAAQVAIASGKGGAADLTAAMLTDPSALTKAIGDLRTTLTSKLPAALQTEIASYGLNLATFDPITAVYIPATTSGYDTILENVSASTPTAQATTLTVKTPTQLAQSMFSELRTTWGTAIAPTTSSINDFMNTQTAQTRADVNATIEPNTTKIQSRYTALSMGIQVFEDAKAYATTSPAVLTLSSTLPDAALANLNATGLYRDSGTVAAIVGGYGEGTSCWTDSATGVTSKVRCFHASSSTPLAVAINIGNTTISTTIKGILYELTSSGANQYAYTATRYDQSFTAPVGTNNWTISAPATLVSVDSVGNTIPVGSGTVSKTTSGSTVTSLTMNGSFPPSATLDTATLSNFGQKITAGADTLKFNITRTALATANAYHYALDGSIFTATLADATKGATSTFDVGSFVDIDETNYATTGTRKALAGKIIGTVQTLATKFTGTFDVSAPSADADGLNYTATHIVFNGSISNLTGSTNAGQFLTGKLDMTSSNYASYHSTQKDSASNTLLGTATFTGTLQAPGRPLMTVTTTTTKTSYTNGTATMQYSYGLDVLVNGTTTFDSSVNAKAVLTLTNQNGVVLILDTTPYTGTITMPTVSGATVLGQISAGVVSYNDGTSVSTNFNQ